MVACLGRLPLALAHENGAVRRERTARDECSGERRDRDRTMVARSPARHNAAQQPCGMRTPQKQRAALPLRLRDGSCLSAFDLEWAVEASLTVYVRLPHRVRVEWWSHSTDRFTRGRWCARFLEFRAVSSATRTINAATASVGCRLMTPLSDLHPRLHGDVRRLVSAIHSCVPSGAHSRSATRARLHMEFTVWRGQDGLGS